MGNRSVDVRNSEARMGISGIFKPVDRWLYFADKSDSKRFLLFLMENYDIFTNDKKIFSDTTAAALKIYFKRTEQASVVKEWIDPQNKVYGLVNLDNAPKFTTMCAPDKKAVDPKINTAPVDPKINTVLKKTAPVDPKIN